jgi:hypothetical protein
MDKRAVQQANHHLAAHCQRVDREAFNHMMEKTGGKPPRRDNRLSGGR